MWVQPRPLDSLLFKKKKRKKKRKKEKKKERKKVCPLEKLRETGLGGGALHSLSGHIQKMVTKKNIKKKRKNKIVFWASRRGTVPIIRNNWRFFFSN